MNGRSHTAVNACSALALNSIFHTVGTAYSWHQIAAIMTGSEIGTDLFSPLLLYKATYYVFIIMCARLPDIDQHTVLGRFLGGHRGFTHSLLGVVLLGLIFATILLCLPLLCTTHGIEIPAVLFAELKVVFEAFLLGWILHVMGDCITRGGVPLFWPSPVRYGFPPSALWRFKVGTMWEDMVVWAIIFFAGFGIGTGLLGI